MHTEKNVFGAITYCLGRAINRKGRRSRANRYNRSGGFVSHNPAEPVSALGSQREFVTGRTKKAAVRKCTTDLSGGFSSSDCGDAPGDVGIYCMVNDHLRGQSVCSWACFTAIRTFDLSSVLHVEPDPAMES